MGEMQNIPTAKDYMRMLGREKEEIARLREETKVEKAVAVEKERERCAKEIEDEAAKTMDARNGFLANSFYEDAADALVVARALRGMAAAIREGEDDSRP